MYRIIILIFSISLVFTSCKKTNKNTTEETPTTMETLDINSEFNWKTTVDYEISLKANQTNIVEVNNADGITYLKAFLTANEIYKMKLTLPTYEKSVILKLGDKEAILELSSTTLNYEFQ